MGTQKNAFPCFNEANGLSLSMEHRRMRPLTSYLQFVCTLLHLLFFIAAISVQYLGWEEKQRVERGSPWWEMMNCLAYLPNYPLLSHRSHVPWSGSLGIGRVSVMSTCDGALREVSPQPLLEVPLQPKAEQLILVAV